jgi:hypothetical protein
MEVNMRNFDWYDKQYRFTSGLYPITLKNFINRYTNAEGKVQETHWATREYSTPSLTVAKAIAECAIREKRCQAAYVWDRRTTKKHTMTRGRREWRPPFEEKNNDV